MELARVGYGASFNTIYISENELIKQAKNEYGKKKLQKEIEVYRRLLHIAPDFPMAKVIRANTNILVLQYYNDYIPLWKFYSSLDEPAQHTLCKKVIDNLDYLHQIHHEAISKDEYMRLLMLETVQKVQERFKDVENLFSAIPFEYVNGVKCITIKEALGKIEQHTIRFVESKSEYTLHYIHGDPQFNNILINPLTQDIIFIDPRGYFGDKEMLGIPEYDIAKVLFALSGYDKFDTTDLFDLTINEGNVSFPSFTLDSSFVSMYTHIHFLLVSIWLANSHFFKDNPKKALVSYAYARYLASFLL